MKKRTIISLLLCAVVLLGYLPQPVSALPVEMLETVPVTQETVSTQETGASFGALEQTTTAVNLPFGQASIKQGCRTIDGMMPLAGSERRFATSQAVFAYEMNTGTVVYSYNFYVIHPDYLLC